MRVSSINVAQPVVKNYNFRNSKVHSTPTAEAPSFKGWGGVLGTVLGAGAGIALTVATGGALAWTIPAISGISGIGGDMYEKKDKPSTDQYGRPLY